jgi:predicted dehydrogenase
MAGGDAFFEEGIHWLHLAGCLGPRIASATGFRPPVSPGGPDRRAKSMLVAFQYDTGAAGAIYYSREVPSLFRGLRFSKLFGRDGVITFESNGALVVARGRGMPRVIVPGLLRDVRGYGAMYRDFLASIREGRQPEMSLERALQDHGLMERIYSGSTGSTGGRGSTGSTGSGPEPGARSLEPTGSSGSDAR